MKKKFTVELLHDKDWSGCSNVYLDVMAKNAFIARKIIERQYSDRIGYDYSVGSVWECKQ